MKKTMLLLAFPALMLVSCNIKREFNVSRTITYFVAAREESENKYYNVVVYDFLATDKGKNIDKSPFIAKDKDGTKIDCYCITSSVPFNTSKVGYYFAKEDKVTLKGFDESSSTSKVYVAFEQDKVPESRKDDFKFCVGNVEVNADFVKVII